MTKQDWNKLMCDTNGDWDLMFKGVQSALVQARADALEEASRALIEYYGHSSGCVQIFEWPFSKEMVDGCNCYTSTRKELSILRALKSQGGEEKA